MSLLFGGLKTPTDVRIRKLADMTYLLEYLVVDTEPEAGKPMKSPVVIGRTFLDCDELFIFLRTYLEEGWGEPNVNCGGGCG
jgi:hypothetical protein